MGRAWWCVWLIVGCGRFNFDEVHRDGAVVADIADDAASPSPVSHLPIAAWTPGSATVVINGDVIIDTDALAITGGLPAGTSLLASPQEPAGPDVAVLAARGFVVMVGATLTVRGSRPLIVVASQAIQIDGLIDAGATASNPGAGGSTTGPGQGLPGNRLSIGDAGGGGGGYGASGAAGGTDNCFGALAGGGGPANGDSAITALVGGSGGGRGSPAGCPGVAGGAGGGAIQLSSATLVSISGVVHAGGAGGGGGAYCGVADSGAGSGGGSGGALFIEAVTVTITGTLAANGGAGGSGSQNQPGRFGDDATADAVPATGGNGIGARGGDGGALGTEAQPGTSTGCSAATPGGGGGGVGRIVLRGDTIEPTGTISPAATTLARL